MNKDFIFWVLCLFLCPAWMLENDEPCQTTTKTLQTGVLKQLGSSAEE